MNFSSVRRSFFVAVRFGTKLFVLFFGWPPQATPGTLSPSFPCPLSLSALQQQQQHPLPALHSKCDSFFVSFRFVFVLVFRFGLVWFGLVSALVVLYLRGLFNGFCPVVDLALNFLCVAKTFVNIVNVIGARTVLWM